MGKAARLNKELTRLDGINKAKKKPIVSSYLTDETEKSFPKVFSHDPEMQELCLATWATYADEINSDSHRYRDAILEKLESEGYQITHHKKP